MLIPEEGRGTAGPPPVAPVAPVAPVVMLRPIRTLVVARDLGFRRRAMTVLVELGPVSFAVVAPDDVVLLVERERAGVVVLDATGCAAQIAEAVLALHDADPRIGVVVVSDEVRRGPHTIPTVAKWGWAADLRAAVMTAYRTGNPLKEEVSDVGT